MPILTDDEVKNFLGLSNALDTRTALLKLAVVGFLKKDLRRQFEQADYTTLFDVEVGQPSLLLEDRPVTAFTSLEKVTSRSEDGTPTYETVDADEYVVYESDGIVRTLNGSFPAGRQRIRATYTAGLTSDQITNNSHDDVVVLKMLALSIIAREFALTKENRRHLRTTSMPQGGSAAYQFDLDFFQMRLRSLLVRGDLPA